MYILFYCDEWKSFSSMEIVGLFSSVDTLKKRIKTEVKENNMEIMNDADIDDLDYDELNTYLEYGFVDYYTVDE